MYTLLFDLFAPDSPATKDYAAIVEKLKSHFEPKSTNVLAHRYTFHRRNQGPNESIAEYVVELRRLGPSSSKLYVIDWCSACEASRYRNDY